MGSDRSRHNAGAQACSRGFCRLLALFGAIVLVSGCTTFSEGFARVDSQATAGDVVAARASHDRLKYPDRDLALQFLNQGMLARLNGDYVASNQLLERAKGLLEEFAKLSLSEQTTSLVTNDELRAFEGAVHERLYVHVIKALNALQLGDRDGARVEVLQLDLLMQDLGQREEKAVARAAPFARYLSGMVFDSRGEPSDAMISYRQALVAYRDQFGGNAGVPPALKSDLLRLTRRLGLTEEYERYRKEFGTAVTVPNSSDSGEVVVFVFDGLAPGLVEKAVNWPDFSSGAVYRIALPAVRPRAYASGSPTMVTTSLRRNGDLGEDIDRLVRADLAEHTPAIAMRAVARQVLKHGAASAVSNSAKKKADNSNERLVADLLSFTMQVAAVLSERADTRNWSTLPGRIWVIRQVLPAGKHAIRIEFDGRVKEFPAVEVVSGDKVFLGWHALGGPSAMPVAAK